MSQSAWEVELKFHLDDSSAVETKLREMGFMECEVQQHEDQYFRHPCRDFTVTDEAFRLRTINSTAMLTYKGPRLAGPVKTREEIELAIEGAEVEAWKLLIGKLGFTPVPAVRKLRRVFRGDNKGPDADLVLTLDQVEQLGNFAEVEIVVSDPQLLASAENRILQLAKSLGLEKVQPKSYLVMLLEKYQAAEV